MFLNDAPPDRECCRKRVEVSACGVTWAQPDFHILPNVCMAAGSSCILKASVAREDISKSKHSAVAFRLGSVCFAQIVPNSASHEISRLAADCCVVFLIQKTCTFLGGGCVVRYASVA